MTVTLRPAPSITGTEREGGHHLGPAQVEGEVGPRKVRDQQAAGWDGGGRPGAAGCRYGPRLEKTLGVAYSAQLSSMSAPSALYSLFAPFTTDLMISTRSLGSSVPQGRLTNMAENLLAPRRSASDGCTDTGTAATSGCGGQLVAPLEIAAQGAGADGQDHVVDRDVECRLQLLDLVERDGGERHLAVWSDGRVERRARGRERQCRPCRRWAARRTRRTLSIERPVRQARRVISIGSGEPAGQCLGDQVRAFEGIVSATQVPSDSVPGRGVGLEVEELGQELGPRHAVDGGVVDLRHQTHVAVLEPLDDVASPTAAWSGPAAGCSPPRRSGPAPRCRPGMAAWPGAGGSRGRQSWSSIQ